MHLQLLLSEKFAPLPFRGRKLIHSYSIRNTRVERDKLFHQRLPLYWEQQIWGGSEGGYTWQFRSQQVCTAVKKRGALSLMILCWLLEIVYFSGDPIVSERKLRFPFLCWCGAGLCQMSHVTGWMTSTRKGEVLLFAGNATHWSPLCLSEGKFCSVTNSFYYQACQKYK